MSDYIFKKGTDFFFVYRGSCTVSELSCLQVTI